MRVLILNWKDLRHPAAGGAEKYTWEVARRLVAAGHEVCWFASRPPGLAATDGYDGIEVVRSGGRLGVYRAARRFWHVEGAGFDLVIDQVNTRPFHTHRFVEGVPVMALIHQVCREVWFSELPWPVAVVGRYLLEPRWLAAYRDTPTITVSPSSKASLIEYGLRCVVDAGEGITRPAPPVAVAKESVPTVLCFGRLSAGKRPDHVLEAMRHVWRDTPEARLWFAGSGPLEARMRRLARRLLDQLGLSDDRVVFWGRVSEEAKTTLMARAWLLAVTSVREGWALVVDEAAACGTPTIGYNRPGLCDSIPAAGGTTTEPSPRALGEAISGSIQRLAVHAGAVVSGWDGGAVSWDEVAERVAAFAADVCRVPLSAAPLTDSTTDSHETAGTHAQVIL